MQLLNILFACLFGLTLAKYSTEKCRLELEGIVYQIKNQNYLYMQQISKVLIAQSPMLFGDENQQNAVLNTFVNEFNVEVIIGDAFGSNALYAPAGDYPPLGATKATSILRAEALNEPAYVVNMGQAYYSFALFDNFAEMKRITISMPVNNLVK